MLGCRKGLVLFSNLTIGGWSRLRGVLLLRCEGLSVVGGKKHELESEILAKLRYHTCCWS